MTSPAPLDTVLALLRALEAGGGAKDISPFLAEDYTLHEAPHLLAPAGAIRNRGQALTGGGCSPGRHLGARSSAPGSRPFLRSGTAE